MEPKPDKDKTILFSGRFDKPHCGHVRTIQLLGQRYKKVLVVVLDYPEQTYPACYRKQVLEDILNNSKGNYEVVINDKHFGKITVDDLLRFEFDVYGAGNMQVLEHLERLRNTAPKTAPEAAVPGGDNKQGERHFEIVWVDRPYDYDSGTERLGKKIQEMDR